MFDEVLKGTPMVLVIVTCLYVCECMFVCLIVCVHVCVGVCMFLYKCVFVRVGVCVCVYVCIMCIYIVLIKSCRRFLLSYAWYRLYFFLVDFFFCWSNINRFFSNG